MVRLLNEKPEKEIDLGEIGKFKLSILEEFRKLNPSPIEEKFKELFKTYNKRHDELMSSRVGIFNNTNIRDIYWKIKELDNLYSKIENIEKSYKKYTELFPTNPKCGDGVSYIRTY